MAALPTQHQVAAWIFRFFAEASNAFASLFVGHGHMKLTMEYTLA